MSWTSTTSCENAVRNSVVAISSAMAISRGQMMSRGKSTACEVMPSSVLRDAHDDDQGTPVVDGDGATVVDDRRRRRLLDDRRSGDRRAGTELRAIVHGERNHSSAPWGIRPT